MLVQNFCVYLHKRTNKVKTKFKHYNTMTREELTKKIETLSQEVYTLGRECYDVFREDNNVTAARLCLAFSVFFKNTSFTMDSFQRQIEMVEE